MMKPHSDYDEAPQWTCVKTFTMATHLSLSLKYPVPPPPCPTLPALLRPPRPPRPPHPTLTSVACPSLPAECSASPGSPHWQSACWQEAAVPMPQVSGTHSPWHPPQSGAPADHTSSNHSHIQCSRAVVAHYENVWTILGWVGLITWSVHTGIYVYWGVSHTHLVSFQQPLSPAHIISQFISRHEGLHGTEPGQEVTVLGQKPLEIVGVHQLGPACFRLRGEGGREGGRGLREGGRSDLKRGGQ